MRNFLIGSSFNKFKNRLMQMKNAKFENDDSLIYPKK